MEGEKDIKATPARGGSLPPEPKPKSVTWILAKGDRLMIPGLFEITNAHLTNPRILDAISAHEAKNDMRIFGREIIRKG
ncbi:MAG TPA: hypothetical protein PLP28_13235 [Flavobacteriales bacterium]|nr:hypothetical protein [Flavobacteriales bacterium]